MTGNAAVHPAAKATVFTRDSKGKLQRAQMAKATSFDELVTAMRNHFHSERALALVLTETLPAA